VEAVINGRRTTLERLLRESPELVRVRSTRVTNFDFDPPVHEATLLHYISANGVEEFARRPRRMWLKSPKSCSMPWRSLMRWRPCTAGSAP
jgi:hypothetical protein